MPCSHAIDWITCSFAKTRDLSEILPEIDQFVITNELPKRRFYQKSYRLACGGVVSLGNEKQGVLIDLSGQPLASLRNAGYTMQDQANLARKARKVSRIDFAIDIQGESATCTPYSLLMAFKEKKIKSNLKPNRIITNLKKEGGQSVYWGGSQSDTQIRVYDKAAEMKELWQAWTRVEMQVRGRTSDAFAYDLSERGVTLAGQAWLKAKFRPSPDCWLSQFLNNDEMAITNVGRKETSFSRWIRTSIGPSFQKHMAIAEDREVIERLFYQLGLS